jgi:hypothetical protein
LPQVPPEKEPRNILEKVVLIFFVKRGKKKDFYPIAIAPKKAVYPVSCPHDPLS